MVDTENSVFDTVKKEVEKLYGNLNSKLDFVLVGKGLKGIVIEITSGDDLLKSDEIEKTLFKILKPHYKDVKIEANCGFRGD